MQSQNILTYEQAEAIQKKNDELLIRASICSKYGEKKKCPRKLCNWQYNKCNPIIDQKTRLFYSKLIPKRNAIKEKKILFI